MMLRVVAKYKYGCSLAIFFLLQVILSDEQEIYRLVWINLDVWIYNIECSEANSLLMLFCGAVGTSDDDMVEFLKSLGLKGAVGFLELSITGVPLLHVVAAGIVICLFIHVLLLYSSVWTIL